MVTKDLHRPGQDGPTIYISQLPAPPVLPINAEREDGSWKSCFGGQGPDPAPGTAELRPPHHKSQHWSDAVLSASNDNPQVLSKP